jgi:GT2 family glycosyltransferase
LIDDPLISIVIPNLNSPMIDQTLSSLRNQAHDMSLVEIIVVGMDEPGLVAAGELIRHIETPRPLSPAKARNLGIRESRGGIICLTDADCIADPHWLPRITAPLRQEVACVVGGEIQIPDSNYWTLCDNLSWFHESLEGASPGQRSLLPTLNLCLKREVVDRVGYLNEDYPAAAGEDAEWTTRMRQTGYLLWFVPGAKIRHCPQRSSFRDIWRHAYTYGRYSVKVQEKYAEFLGILPLFRRWWILLILAPLLSFGSALRVYTTNRLSRRYVYTLPGIWLSKLAWVLGAVRTLYRGW